MSLLGTPLFSTDSAARAQRGEGPDPLGDAEPRAEADGGASSPHFPLPSPSSPLGMGGRNRGERPAGRTGLGPPWNLRYVLRHSQPCGSATGPACSCHRPRQVNARQVPPALGGCCPRLTCVKYKFISVRVKNWRHTGKQ